jgi:hypothetical protein
MGFLPVECASTLPSTKPTRVLNELPKALDEYEEILKRIDEA